MLICWLSSVITLDTGVLSLRYVSGWYYTLMLVAIYVILIFDIDFPEKTTVWSKKTMNLSTSWHGFRLFWQQVPDANYHHCWYHAVNYYIFVKNNGFCKLQLFALYFFLRYFCIVSLKCISWTKWCVDIASVFSIMEISTISRLHIFPF